MHVHLGCLKTALAAALLVVAGPSAAGTMIPFVDGGRPVPDGELPFLVDIEVRSLGSQAWLHGCGASMIADDLVISAAHCFFNPQTGLPHEGVEWRLVFDRTDRSQPADQAVEGAGFSMVAHPRRDVVFIRLHAAREGAATARLPPVGVTPPAGLVATLAGWGFTENEVIPDRLHSVELPIVAPELCDVPYEHHSKQQGEFPRLCAGSPGKGSRAGDSGGPLFTRDPQSGAFVLRGIVSGGRPGYPGGYVNLADPDLWE